MTNLDLGYIAEIDRIDKNNWNNLLMMFEDASFYQTWSYGAIKTPETNLSHLVLKKDDKIVSMVQIRISKFPLLPIKIAYIHWGPMCKLKGGEINISHLRNMIKALYSEYVVRRGYFLRILPKIFDENHKDEIINVFKDEKFSWSPDPTETIVLNLSPTIQVLRQNLSKGHKNSLNYASKQNITIIEKSDNEGCDILLKIAKEMKLRKKYMIDDQEELLSAHKDLPDMLKLHIIICYAENIPVAALGWSKIGKIGMVLVGGTGNMALKLKVSVLLWWKMLEFYKNHGFIKCDFAGVNQKNNPGGFQFKKGFVGKNFEKEMYYLGQFDASNGIIIALLFKVSLLIRILYRKHLIKMIGTLLNIRSIFTF